MKMIPISKGFEVLVDDEDFERLQRYRWFVNERGPCRHAYRCWMKNGVKGRIYLHREILGAPSGMVVDHINGNGLDNRRINLRLCTQKQNRRNQRKPARGKTSSYKGVSKSAGCNKFRAQITVNRKVVYLGEYDSEIIAAKTYDEAAKAYFGDFANLNFPIPLTAIGNVP
jgi:hypothetical protein